MEEKQLLQTIMLKAYEINKKTVNNIFVRFAGNSNTLSVYYSTNFCKRGKGKMFKYICFELKLDNKNCVKELQRVSDELTRLYEESIGYGQIKNIISDIDQYHTEAELREILQQILFICEDNIQKELFTSEQTENK